MTFNIGNQNGGIINNVAGDQHVNATQHGTTISRSDAHDAAGQLHALLRNSAMAGLSSSERTEAADEAAALEQELASAEPSQEKVKGRLERLIELIGKAGAITTAGAALIPSLTAIAQYLGPLGERALALLG